MNEMVRELIVAAAALAVGFRLGYLVTVTTWLRRLRKIWEQRP